MSPKKHGLPEEQQAKLIEILNRRLADAIDLQLQCRQAYWNVKGTTFLSLRELFDKVTKEVEVYANLIAEHIVQLGGKAEGTARVVAERRALGGHGLAKANTARHLQRRLLTLGDIPAMPARRRVISRTPIRLCSSPRLREAPTSGSGSLRPASPQGREQSTAWNAKDQE